ncbi:hypothetical protein ABK040_013112 [Willaertia magna]
MKPLLSNETTTSSVSSSHTISTNLNTIPQQQYIHPLHHYCQEHKDQITDIKCYTCKILICIKCALYKHKQHDATLLKDCIKEEKEGLIKLLNEGKEKINEMTNRKTRIENTIVKIENRIELNKNEMKNEFNEVYNCLKLKEEQLLKEINDSKKEKIDILENEIKLLNENLQQLNKLCQINDLNSLQDIDLGINKLKLENNKITMNEVILQNKLYNFTNFFFKINTNEIITKINELTKIEEKKELIGFSNQFEFVGQFGLKGSGNGQFDLPYDILIDNDLIYILRFQLVHIKKNNIKSIKL